MSINVILIIVLFSGSLEQFKASQYFPKGENGGKPVLHPKKTIYMYIWYLSNTITFRQLGIIFSVATSIAWKAVNRSCLFILSIGHQYVKWPSGDEIREITCKFEAKKGNPGVIGAIDCTHISIKAPTTSKESFFGRKKTYSITLQAVVDPDKLFRSITCGESGSLHDSRVLRRSELYRRAQENREE